MNKNKKFRVLSIIAVVAVFAGIIYYTGIYNRVKEVNIQCSYMKYSTSDELHKNADLILIGTALEKFEDRDHYETRFDDGNLQDFYTKTKFKAQKIIKMPEKLALTKDSVFDIIEPVGLIQESDGRKILKLEGYEPLKEKEIYVVFLKDNGFGEYSIINMNGGRFNLQNDENYDNQESKIQSDVISKYKKEVQ